MVMGLAIFLILVAFLAGFEIGVRLRYEKQRLSLCETSLSIWDNTRSSEYWLRYPQK